MKKTIGVGSLSLLLAVLALLWSYSVFGFCLGDKILTALNLPAWSENGAEQTANTVSIVPLAQSGSGVHYTVFYALIFLLPALAIGIKFKGDLFAAVGKWLSALFLILLLISPLLMII